MSGQASVTREIAASPERVWNLVSDLPRMGEWSNENQGGRWLEGATGPVVGARFEGENANESKRWTTVATVTECEPGQTFAFAVSVKGFLPVARWRYDIEPTATGCRVTESWSDARPGLFRPLAKFATGVGDREQFARAGMEHTLEELARTAESTDG